MAIKVDVRADVSQIRAMYAHLGKGVDRAAARALNDTVRTLRAEGARAIKRHHRAMKIGQIKREMKIERANPKRLSASVDVTGKPTSLTLFQARQLKRGGVKATIGNTRSLITFKGRKAFIVPKYGNEVFARRFATGRQMRRLRGPSLPGVFRAREKEFTAIAQDRFPKAFRSRIQFEIAKAEKVAAARASAPSKEGFSRFFEGQFRLVPGSLGA